jgi:hypothetical protein
MSLTAKTKSFDPAVTSGTGDIWLASVDQAFSFAPVVIDPGRTGVVEVTITPSATPGSVVSGKLYVDDFLDDVPPFGQITGDELAAIPYSYTVGFAPPAGTRIAGAGPPPR